MRDSKINIKKAVEILRHDYMGNIRLALENIFKKNYLAKSSITFVKRGGIPRRSTDLLLRPMSSALFGGAIVSTLGPTKKFTSHVPTSGSSSLGTPPGEWGRTH